MDADTINLIYTVIRLVGGFFDFITFVAVMVVALMYVRKADGTLGYVLAGATSVRFLFTCCSNASSGLQEQLGETAVLIGAALSSIMLFVDLAMWGAVLFVLYSLASKAPQQG